MITAWFCVIGILVTLAALDLWFFNRRSDEAVRPAAAWGWASFYLLIAVAFNLALWLAARDAWFHGFFPAADAKRLSLEFVSTLLLDLVLDLDIVFVFAVVFDHLRLRRDLERRVLFYGFFIALLLQGGLILSLTALTRLLPAASYFLAALLLLAALRMLLIRSENADPHKSPVVRILRRFFPESPTGDGGALLTTAKGRTAFTPLLIALVLLESADLIFSLDTVPAAFAVTKEPLIIFAANGFGLLVQRSLFFAIRDLRPSIKYLKVGLALILGHCAVAVSLPTEYRLKPEVFLIVIAAAAGLGLLLAARYQQAPDPAHISPLGPDAERLARFTLKQARKIIVLVLGVTTVILGIIMIVAPGPAIVVIPLGLAFLATEFLWARRLLNRYSGHAQTFATRAQHILAKKPRPRLVVPVLLVTIGGLVAVCYFVNWPVRTTLLVASPVLAFVGLWAFTTLRAAYGTPTDAPTPTPPPHSAPNADTPADQSHS